jgi:predicted component of type VI protein secretion system
MNLIWSHKFSSIFQNLSEKTRTLMSQCVKTRTFWLIPTTRLTLQNEPIQY